MRREVRALRDAAVQAAQFQRVPFRDFLQAGLEGVLQDADSNHWSPQEMAAQLLATCCLTDGKFNNFQVGFLAVMTFLNEQLHSPGDQAYRDLAQILKTTGNINAIRRWMESQF
ncbi:MAG: hypothetical protein K2R98_26235 [Gemmataceae bacterium]|nr:hypothetical protein [Gemmataceae bacterium]